MTTLEAAHELRWILVAVVGGLEPELSRQAFAWLLQLVADLDDHERDRLVAAAHAHFRLLTPTTTVH